MNIKLYYFSATGNSLYVAKRISEEIEGCSIFSIPKIYEDNKLEIEADLVGFIYPIHCGSLPIIVEKFLEKVKIKGSPDIFAIGVTGGGGAEMSFKHINKILGEEHKLFNGFTVKYISNYIRAGRNATSERVNEVLERNESVILEVINKIKNREKRKIGKNLGINSIIYNTWKSGFKNKDKGFNVNSDCIGCKICASVCPVKNISLVEKRPTWNGKCIDCMACINLCPKKAINIGNKTIKKERYKNPNINVDELF